MTIIDAYYIGSTLSEVAQALYWLLLAGSRSAEPNV